MNWHIWQTAQTKWQQANSASRFGSSLALTMATNGLLAFLSLLTGSLVARLLGPAGRGELAAIQTWPTFIAVLAMLGVPDALVYYSAKTPAKASQLLATAVFLALIACLPFAVVGYYLMPWLLQAQTTATIQAARSYLWVLPIYATVGMLQHPLRGRNSLGAWNLVRLWPILAWLGVLVWGWLAQVQQAIPIAQLYLLALALLFVPMGAIVRRYLPGSLRPAPSEMIPLLRYGLPSALSSVPSMLNLRLDQMLMAVFLSPDLLGLYVVAVAWSSAVAPLSEALTAVALPRIAASSSPAEQTQVLGQTLRLGVLLIILLMTAVALLAPLMIPFLFGWPFAQAVPVAVVLAIAAGFLAFKQLLQANALGLGQPRVVLWTESMGLVATIGLLWLLLRPFQLMGAAVASLISYSLVCVLLVYQIKNSTNLSLPKMLIPMGADMLLVLERLKNLRASLRATKSKTA